MSVTEILDEISKLPVEERHLLVERLYELEGVAVEETPELLTAFDDGIRSLEREGTLPWSEVRSRLKAKWPTR